MRQQEFNTQEVLGKAMNVFWSKGYKGASLQDLLDEMGIGKGSFYAAFGSKHELFIDALRHFGETKARQVTDLLADPPAKMAVARVFDRIIDGALTNRRGCMFGKAAFEFWQSDPQVAKEVAGGVNQVEQAFHQVVVRGQEDGDIQPERDAQVLAHFLTGIFYGLQVMASANPDRETLNHVVSMALAVLD